MSSTGTFQPGVGAPEEEPAPQALRQSKPGSGAGSATWPVRIFLAFLCLAWMIPVIGLLRLPGAPPLNSALGYLFGLLAVTSLTHMVFFGDDRYHLAISPVFCILAAAALRRPAKPALAPAPIPVETHVTEAATS